MHLVGTSVCQLVHRPIQAYDLQIVQGIYVL